MKKLENEKKLNGKNKLSIGSYKYIIIILRSDKRKLLCKWVCDIELKYLCDCKKIIMCCFTEELTNCVNVNTGWN